MSRRITYGHRATHGRAYNKSMKRTELRRLQHDWFEAVKVGRGCMDCGTRPSNPRLLHWHHRDPSTCDFHISSSYQRPWVVVALESAKCDVVCADCHWERHRALRAARG